MEEIKYKMVIAYEGTRYSGWQVQPNGLSIQEVIQKAISISLRSPCDVTGAGRTDAGVHALGQVGHFVFPERIDTHIFLRSINGLLPPDIRIKSIEEVPQAFHARRSATGKIYHYHLHYAKIANPFTRLYSWHVLEKIDLSLLEAATLYFLGEHDFTSFANEAHKGCAAKDPVRTIQSIVLLPEEGAICLAFEGNGFLYKMVRNIVGTLVRVAMGKRPIESIPDIFAAKDRRLADQAAPPHGLFLKQVFYPDAIASSFIPC